MEKHFDQQLAKCGKLRARALSAMSRAASLETQVNMGPGFSWARNGENIGKITTMVSELQNDLKEQGLISFLNFEWKALKQQYGKQTLGEMASKFEVLSPKVVGIENAITMMLAMHGSRSQQDKPSNRVATPKASKPKPAPS